MATINPYGKQEGLVARGKARRRITIIAVSTIVLVAVNVISVGGVFGVSSCQSSSSNKQSHNQRAISSSIEAACSVTLYPESCFNSLTPLVKSPSLSPVEMYRLSLQAAIDEIKKSTQLLREDLYKNDGTIHDAILNCQELLQYSITHINNALALNETKSAETLDYVKGFLTTAGSNQQACIDDLKIFSSSWSELSKIVDHDLKNSTEYVSNSLAIASRTLEVAVATLGPMESRRRLMMSEAPEWVAFKVWRLLQSKNSIKADAVVAKDGSGQYKTIGDALRNVPDKSNKSFVIYVKKGVYVENVRVEESKWNVVMVGDGKNSTIVSGSLNNVDGTPTFQTASFAVIGQGFLARDMGFINTAGPAKYKAVALMSTSDMSIFYRCSFDAYQGTLYVHGNWQFYRECDIYGTVDFIFGNAAIVIQNCNILPKRPMPGQQNTITAQGKFDPNQNSGISIQNCTIQSSENLTGVNTFLGRPWKNYSTTVFFNNMMEKFIDPKGWLPLVGTSTPDTIFYAEFQNFGPGAVTAKRVKWAGLKLNLTTSQVEKFTVKSFIHGNKWIPWCWLQVRPLTWSLI